MRDVKWAVSNGEMNGFLVTGFTIVSDVQGDGIWTKGQGERIAVARSGAICLGVSPFESVRCGTRVVQNRLGDAEGVGVKAIVLYLNGARNCFTKILAGVRGAIIKNEVLRGRYGAPGIGDKRLNRIRVVGIEVESRNVAQVDVGKGIAPTCELACRDGLPGP